MALTIELQAPDRMLHTRERGFKSITRDWEKRWTRQNSRLFEGKTTWDKAKQDLCPAQARLFTLFLSLFLSRCPEWDRGCPKRRFGGATDNSHLWDLRKRGEGVRGGPGKEGEDKEGEV